MNRAVTISGAAILLSSGVMLCNAQMAMPRCPASTPASEWTACVATWSAPGGGKYDGEWRDGKQDGSGSYQYPKGDSYVGEWRDGKEDGYGVYTWTNGQRYEGRWRNGKRDGWGVLTYVDSRRYVGFWQDDVRSGQGILYNSDGVVDQAGLWSAGSLAVTVFLDTQRFPFAEALSKEGGSPARPDVVPDAAVKEKKSPDEQVRLCIATGVRPGTPEFSQCMSDLLKR